MYSLGLVCSPEEVDLLSGELWEAGTTGIRELEQGDSVVLLAGFETDGQREVLLDKFAAWKPSWEEEDDTDWILESQCAWPGREVGRQFFLAPPWNADPIPMGRKRIIHNPGTASGTGEHPCTQLALMALETCVSEGDIVIDVGCGSGVLAIGALQLGAKLALALDTDEAALPVAKENFELNQLNPTLAAGSAECMEDECANVTVANISGTVLVAIADDLLRITRPGGWLILTGFPESELRGITETVRSGVVSEINEWRCLTLRLS